MPFIRSMQILIIIVVVCVLIAGAFALGLHYGKNTPQTPEQASVPTPQSQVQQILEKTIEESGVFNGTIVAINGRELTIDTQIPTLNPTETPSAKRRVIQLTDKTQITKRTAKPAEEIQKSQEAFIQSIIKNSASATPPATPPTTYTETPATTADLATGITITINTVKEGNAYIATTIAIN